MILAYTALAIALTWPVLPELGRVVPGAGRTDLWNSLWGLWFVSDSLRAGELPWHTTALGWPDGGVIAVADPLNSLIGLPLMWALGPAAAYGLLVIGNIAFAGVAAHGLAAAVHGDRRAAWVAGVAYACAPVLISGVQNGTSEATSAGWLPLAGLALLHATRTGGWRAAALAGLALWLASAASWYSAGCAWLLWLAFVLLGEGALRERLKRLGLAGALALSLTLPLGLAMQAGSTHPDNLVGIKNARELSTVRRTIGSADPRGWLRPGDFRSPDFRRISRYGEEFVHSHYLGLSLLALGLVALVRRRGGGRSGAALGAAGGAAALLAMGPVVVMDGQPLVIQGRLALALPYVLLEPLPGFSSLSLLWRMALMPSLALSVLAAGAVAGREGRGGLALVAGALALVGGDLRVAAPTAGLPELESAEVEEPIRWLAQAPEGAVMNFPVVGGRGYLHEQTVHGKPLAAGLNFPNNVASRAVWAAMLDGVERGLSGEAFAQAVARVARKRGVRYLVVHIDPMARPDMHDAAVSAARQWLETPISTPSMRIHQLW
ncbi:MAG: hypothetical protein H6741_11300 [Alphaproteobacteria bacterium]|nr:hypothetical protein [Alphaproteobacteria bacterium]